MAFAPYSVSGGGSAADWAALKQRQAAAAGGGGGSGLQDIIKQMQAQQEKANLLNEQRYQQVLAQFEGLGKAGRARIEQQTLQRQAEATQSLTSRGLGGTTITSAVERGIAGESELQRQQLEESVAMQKAGVMERRTDVGPDLGMFAGLLQAAGQQPQGGRGDQVISSGFPGFSQKASGPSATWLQSQARRKGQIIGGRTAGLKWGGAGGGSSWGGGLTIEGKKVF